MKKTTISHSIIPLLLCGVLLYSLFIPNIMSAATFNVNLADPNLQGLEGEALVQGITNQINNAQNPTKTFTNLFNFMMGFVGIAAFFMITWGGIQYSSSAGNPSMLQAAKDKIWGAIFGLILAGFSVVILQTINPDLVKFRLSTPTTTSATPTTNCVPSAGNCDSAGNVIKQDTNDSGAPSGSSQPLPGGGASNQQPQVQ